MCVLSAGVITQGLCLPQKCTSDGLEAFFAYAANCPAEFNRTLQRCAAVVPGCSGKDTVCAKVLDAVEKLFSELKMEKAHCGNSPQGRLDGGAVVMLLVVIAIFGCCLFQAWLEYRETLAEDQLYDESEVLIDAVSARSIQINAPPVKKRRGYRRIFACFSVKDNLIELLQSSPARTLRPLDALRAISMFWIILGHGIIFMNAPEVGFQNLISEEPKVLGSFSDQFLVSIPFTVDTFFFLSGLLTAYVIARKSLKGFRLPVIMSIAFRYLRLAPLVMVVVGVYSTLMKYAGDGPLWYR